MTDIIAKHNHGFMGKGGKLLRIRSILQNYGLLYNWYAATDSRNLANEGWRVSSDEDIINLREYIDPSGTPFINIAGGKLKEIGFTHWDSPNTDATDDYGFSARAGGNRYDTGPFGAFRAYHNGWTTKEYMFDTTRACMYSMDYLNNILLHHEDYAGWYHTYKGYGMSIRLIKEDSTDPGVYVGNDGKIYSTVKIGNQVWIAQSIAETKYRNGDTIPEVINNTAWAALTTGALCAYGHNWNNV